MDELYGHADGRRLHSYAGAILVWRGNRFVEIEEETIRQQVQPWLHDALRYQYNKQSQQMELVDFESNPGTIKAAVESIRAHAHLPASITPPFWLDQRLHPPDPRYLLPFPSGTLNLATGTTIPPTPALFNINAIDFNYEPNPDPPDRWIRFMDIQQVGPGRRQFLGIQPSKCSMRSPTSSSIAATTRGGFLRRGAVDK